jgi:hypothetical protein
VIGRTVSHYRMIENLGGGMGVFYKGEDKRLPRKQASSSENIHGGLLDCGEDLHPVLRRDSAHISDSAWSGTDVFD